MVRFKRGAAASCLALALALAISGAAAPQAQAADFTVTAASGGWIRSDGVVSPTSNYLAGFCNCLSGVYEYRNAFAFDVPTFSGTIVSARLVLNAGFVQLNQAPAFSYQITSVDGLPDTFAELGTGTIYGSGEITGANFAQPIAFTLNAAARSALQSGGTFRLSGRGLGLDIGPTSPTQSVFGLTSGANASLEFTTRTGAVVPEPGTWALLIAGFGLAGGALRRRRAQVA